MSFESALIMKFIRLSIISYITRCIIHYEIHYNNTAMAVHQVKYSLISTVGAKTPRAGNLKGITTSRYIQREDCALTRRSCAYALILLHVQCALTCDTPQKRILAQSV